MHETKELEKEWEREKERKKQIQTVLDCAMSMYMCEC